MRLRYEKCMNSRAFKDPKQRINDNYMAVEMYMKTMENEVMKKLKDSKLEAAKLITKLDTLSPLKTLTRGYSIVETDGKVITKAKDLKKDMQIDLRFQDGNAKAKIL